MNEFTGKAEREEKQAKLVVQVFKVQSFCKIAFGNILQALKSF